MTFAKYPKMKDSGIEWIGEIPEEWKIQKLKHVCIKIVDGVHKTPEYENSGIPFISVNNFTRGKLDFSKTKFISKNSHIQLIKRCNPEKGDLILSKVGTLGQVDVIENEFEFSIFVQLALLKLNKEKLIPIFLKYFLKSNLSQIQIILFSNQTTLKYIGINDIELLPVFIPSMNEQKQIASYLDKKTKTIDDEITKNQNLIKLLQEKRQSEINHAVTKGLDDTVPMKDSGIEWIGEIPKHWNIMKLKRLVNLSQGIQIPEDKQIDGEEKGYVRFLRIVDFTDNAKSRYVNKFDNNSFLEKDEIVMIRYGASAGKVFRGLKGVFANNMFKLISNYLLTNNFLFDFLNQQLVQDHITEMSPVNTMPNINHNIVYDLNIPLPSLNEQKQITNFIYSKTAKIDSLISKIQLQISTLQEFRTSLISSAVTGKICVTN